MDKGILAQYMDARELIRETEEDIRRVRRQRKTVVQDKVKGSMVEFPYAEQSFRIQGVAYSVASDPGALGAYERLLEKRKARAEEIRLQVEEWLVTVPQRMQRIIRFRFFEGMSWGETAARMGRKATADSVRKEYMRFMEND